MKPVIKLFAVVQPSYNGNGKKFDPAPRQVPLAKVENCRWGGETIGVGPLFPVVGHPPPVTNRGHVILVGLRPIIIHTDPAMRHLQKDSLSLPSGQSAIGRRGTPFLYRKWLEAFPGFRFSLDPGNGKGNTMKLTECGMTEYSYNAS